MKVATPLTSPVLSQLVTKDFPGQSYLKLTKNV